jgi:UDP-N-acetylmuramate dehydrogenase
VVQILRAEALQPFNTLALQAQATALLRVERDEQLPEAFTWAAAQGLPVIPLGEGSNIVVAGDLDALLLRLDTRGITRLRETDEMVVLRVAAGENWHALVQWTLQRDLFGLENLALIPGTVGAAPIQNIGAYGVELAPHVEAVHGRVIAGGEPFTLSGQACEFGYRDSIFKHGLRDQRVITAVDLQLSKIPRIQADYPALGQELADRQVSIPSPRDVFDAVVSIRSSKLPDPALVPNAGSFFKNPVIEAGRAMELVRQFPELPRYEQPGGQVKLAAAWMIQHCGWKGHRNHGLGVHPEHALVLVNYGCDSGRQLLELAAEVARSVRDSFGIELEIEPRVYGRRG